MKALRYSETSVLTRAKRHNIPDNAILHSHRRENLKSYTVSYNRARPVTGPAPLFNHNLMSHRVSIAHACVNIRRLHLVTSLGRCYILKSLEPLNHRCERFVPCSLGSLLMPRCQQKLLWWKRWTGGNSCVRRVICACDVASLVQRHIPATSRTMFAFTVCLILQLSCIGCLQ
jgi:hypothetical protein